MLEVTVTRTIRKSESQIFTNTICLCLHGFDRLTPRAARAAMEIAFGQPYGGHVSFGDVTYVLYPKSARRKKAESGK